jgi:hypothetical protein
MEFDLFAIQERQRLLDETSFTARERGKVGKVLMHSVLQRIGKYRECCESQNKFAKSFSVARETITRCINRLARLDVITIDLRYNHRYKKTLNHYRVNWTELDRRLKKTLQTNSEIGTDKRSDQLPSDVTISLDRCDNSPKTDVTISLDRCDTSPKTDVSLCPTERELSLKETKQQAEWSCVVSFLNACKVARVSESLRAAKTSFNSPDEALSHLRPYMIKFEHDSRLGGVISNQCHRPTPLHIDIPKPPPKKNYIREAQWADCGYCSLEELQMIYPGRPLEPRLQAIFDSQRSEASA